MSSEPCIKCGTPSRQGQPCPKCGITVFEPTVRERGAASDIVERDLHELPRPGSSFVQSSTQDRSAPVKASHVTVDDAGRMKARMVGRAPRNEEGSCTSAGILLERIRERDGNPWGPIQSEKQIGPVDCYSVFETKRLNFQITRLGPPALWEELSTRGEARPEKADFTGPAVDAIREAIEHKNYGSPGDIILGLAADITPQYASDEVAVRFRESYGQWARDRGFQEIWIIGPTLRHCFRLD